MHWSNVPFALTYLRTYWLIKTLSCIEIVPLLHQLIFQNEHTKTLACIKVYHSCPTRLPGLKKDLPCNEFIYILHQTITLQRDCNELKTECYEFISILYQFCWQMDSLRPMEVISLLPELVTQLMSSQKTPDALKLYLFLTNSSPNKCTH